MRARAPARRIVSIAPSTTEALFAIGAGPHVVGVSRFCDYPPEVRTLPKVGGFTDPSLEAILGLEADLVVGARSPSNRGVVAQLEARGVGIYFPANDSLGETRELLRGLGERTGNRDGAARAIARMDDELVVVRRALAGRPRPRVLLVFAERPLSVAGPRSFADEMVLAAGGDNVVKRGGEYPTLGVEAVLELAPEVILVAREAMDSDRTQSIDWARYPSIPAVRDGRVVRVGDARVLRPGPRIGEGVRVLAHALHPDVTIP